MWVTALELSRSDRGTTQVSRDDRVVPYRPHPRRSFGEALRRRVLSLGTWWRSSLTVRVVSLVMAAGLASMLAAGTIIVSQVRSQLFDRAVTSVVDLFESSRAGASVSPSAGRIS